MAYLIYSVEDDTNIANIIKLTLKHQGYEVCLFKNGKDFFEAFNERKPNLILLDLMLPDMSGSDILKEIRHNKNNDEIRVIIVSAKSMITDKVEGLDLGADDYIAKPFDILELISRVNALKRRQDNNRNYQLNNTLVDINKRKCYQDDVELNLTKKEFDILALLLTRHNEVVSRMELINHIWGDSFEYETRTIDMHIKSLRKKLGEDGDLIETIYGVGYMVNL